ncbi:MAG: HAMP domain-containing protein [Verrucomicrobia bacterium]|nr:HAMP domain-containing protein [Kiritimatiellia bacterium]MCP5487264.1 HAMP domain-containing protein [Verrucomicrobiota bacterium]
MKSPLQVRYFRGLIRLIFLMFGLYALILLGFNLVEWREHAAPLAEEAGEFLILLVLMLFSIPLILIAAWRIAGQLLEPLQSVVSTAERIREGNLDERIPLGPDRDELTRLSVTINHAFDSYSGAMNRLERFSADASHQLRTPLAAIRATADIGLQQERSPEEYRDAMGAILEQSGRLQHTVDQLLLMARMDSSLRQRMQSVNLADHLAEWIAEMAPLAADRGITLTGEGLDYPGWIFGDSTLLREVFHNLLNNAMNAIPREGTIRMSLKPAEPGWLNWLTEDSGPGISPADRERILDRFYRGATGAGSGSGLGLAIVKDILALHQGDIFVDPNSPLGGASIRIRLPLEKTREA